LPPSGKTAGTNFSQEAEDHHFHPARATRCNDSSEIWPGQETPGLLERAHGGGDTAPKYQQFSLFGKDEGRRGEPVVRLGKMLGTFMASSYLH